MKLLGICLNWKVLVGLGVLAAAALIVDPGLFPIVLPVAAILACPLSCLFMMKRMGGRDEETAGVPTAQARADEARIARLREELVQLRAELRGSGPVEPLAGGPSGTP